MKAIRRDSDPQRSFLSALEFGEHFLKGIEVETYIRLANEEKIKEALDSLLLEIKTKDLNLPPGLWASFDKIGKTLTGNKHYIENLYGIEEDS